jgi:flap endonuclease-1
MILGIDLSIFLYKYLYNNDDHLEGLTRLVLRLLKNQITPLFVFDGKPPKEKDETIQSRKDKREYLNIKKNLVEKCIHFDRSNINIFKDSICQFIDTTDSDFHIDHEEIHDLYEKSEEELIKESIRIMKKIIYVTQYHIDSSKKLFDLFGIRYIHAPCEAEALLALLCKNNVIHGCISEDMDLLPNGGYLFLRNFNADKNTVDEYCLHGILENLKFTIDKFIDMCILCGCDYTTKINGMGPITSYKLICKYENIENFIKNNDKFVIPENFNYEKARFLFKHPLDEDIYKSIDKSTKMNKPNINELKEFLHNTLLKEKFKKEIEKDLINYYLNIEGLNQMDKTKKITDFFASSK